ncbi:MAG: type I secretion system permease/ATPase, partial [Alphaproteobacteria bacterium]
RTSMLSHVSKLLVLKNGRVEAFGPKDEVLPTLTGKAPAKAPAKAAADKAAPAPAAPRKSAESPA